MYMMKFIKYTSLGLLLVPGIASAAVSATADLTFFDGLVTSLSAVITALIPVIIALGILLFIWGLVKFIMASGDEEAAAEGKRLMIWGVIALFVIVTVWGLVALLNQLTGIDQDTGFDAIDVVGT